MLYNSAGDGEQGREMRTLIQVRTHACLIIVAVQILQAEYLNHAANSFLAFYRVLFSLMLRGLFEKEQFLS